MVNREHMRDIVGTVVVSVPILNEATQGGIITALRLDEMVLLGITWGAWFQVGMGIALVLLIVERGISIKNKLTKKT